MDLPDAVVPADGRTFEVEKMKNPMHDPAAVQHHDSSGASALSSQRRTHDHSVWSVQAEGMLGASLMAEPPEIAAPPHESDTGLSAPPGLFLAARNSRIISPVVGEFTVREGSGRLYTPRDRGEADNEEVVCPDCLRSMDLLLTLPSGKPTTLFRFSQACCIIQGPHILVGTFCSPGGATKPTLDVSFCCHFGPKWAVFGAAVLVAAEKEDKLMALALLSVAIMLAGSALILEDVSTQAIRRCF